MTTEDRRETLRRDGLPPPEVLDAWEVPAPSPGLADSIVASIAPRQPPEHEHEQHQPAMFTDPSSPASPRSLLAPALVGFAIAAGLLLAFFLGRVSNPPGIQPSVVVSPSPLETSNPPAVVSQSPAREPATQVIVVPFPLAPAQPSTEAIEDDATSDPARTQRSSPRSGSSRSKVHEDLKDPWTNAPNPSTETDQDSGYKDPFADGETAMLRIGTEPGVPPAEIYIDGRVVGRSPVSNAKVEPGRHSIQWRWPDGKIVTKRITVTSGEIKIVKGG